MITKQGLYYDISAAAYHKDPCEQPSFTQSIGKVLLDQSPAHARLAHPKLAPPVADDDEELEKYVAAKAIGDAAHALLIGRGKMIAVGDYDSWRKGDAQEFRETALLADQTPILAKHYERAEQMVDAAREQIERLDNGYLGNMFHPALGNGEVVLTWQESGLWLRTMVDWLGGERRGVVDYKSSGLSCAPHVVEDRPSVMGWDLQAAMHERGLDALDPDNAGRRKHYYVNQENEPPYALTVIEISEADLTLGRKKLAMAFGTWSACMKSGHWPLYPAETVLSRPRGHLESKFLEREIVEHERHKRAPMLSDLSGG